MALEAALEEPGKSFVLLAVSLLDSHGCNISPRC